MATGIVFTVKQDLLDSVSNKVFANNNFGILAKNEQQALLDMVESLWNHGSSSSTSVASLRAASIPQAASGTTINALPLSATTISLTPGTSKGYQIVTGTGVLTGNTIITGIGSPLDGDRFIVDYRATVSGSFSVTIFGIALTTTQKLEGNIIVIATYDAVLVGYRAVLLKTSNNEDLVDTIQLATKEPLLGNPATNGWALVSTTAGVRSWVAKENDLGNPGTNGYVVASTTSGTRSWVNKENYLSVPSADGDALVSTISGTRSFTSLKRLVANTVFVDPIYGSDSTGLVERQDKPFLTITAAENAALTYYTTRTQTARVLIDVMPGEMTGALALNDFIDYRFSNNTINAPAAQRTIYDSDLGTNIPRTFVVTTSNIPNVIIYGKAQFIDTQTNMATLEMLSNMRLHLEGVALFTTVRKSILMRSGYLRIQDCTLYMSDASVNNNQTISLSTNNAYANAPTLEAINCKIYNNPTGAINSTVEFYNGLYPNHNTDYCRASFVNCEIGNWSSLAVGPNGRGAISGAGAASGGGSVVTNAVSLAKITLKNTIIYSANNPSIEDNYHVTNYPYNDFQVSSYGSFANKAMVLAAPSSSTLVGTLTVDADVRMNQGLAL